MHERENHHFRDLPSYLFRDERVPKEFQQSVAALVLPHLNLERRKLKQKQEIATYIVHNLVVAEQVGGCVSDSRSTQQAGVRLRKSVWDAIIAAGFAEVCIGSESSGKVSRYRATSKLLRLFDTLTSPLIDSNLERNTLKPKDPTWHALVVLQSKQKELLPLPPEHLATDVGGVTVGEYLSLVEDTIESINRSNTSHGWQAFKIVDPATMQLRAFQPSVCLKQKHSGTLFQYTRLYTWSALSAQSLSKRERRLIRIDGERVTELDYSGHQLRILYHITGVDPDPNEDLYRMDSILPKFQQAAISDRKRDMVRDFVKAATIICLNVASRIAAEKAVDKQLFENAELARLMRKVEDVDGRCLVRRIERVHSAVADRFFTNVGASLTTLDGTLMLRILRAFADEKRPALGIHDSILCKASDGEFARSMMRVQYLGLLGYEPVVKTAF